MTLYGNVSHGAKGQIGSVATPQLKGPQLDLELRLLSVWFEWVSVSVVFPHLRITGR